MVVGGFDVEVGYLTCDFWFVIMLVSLLWGLLLAV